MILGGREWDWDGVEGWEREYCFALGGGLGWEAFGCSFERVIIW